ncbi:hypothetical protein OIHEL45_16254 [Sulfitobacter indolifex HEL-45]|uniref:Uncharacterized protein n=2 Tax=Sulfitobacter indolifex TaxID=225422 RepID=A0ABM9X4W8_9RHOB|nr:hypothetical protein OIHEL45_16254 [Sulfitobacter indolifex HEL-45]
MPRNHAEQDQRFRERRSVPWSEDQTEIEYYAICVYQYLVFNETKNTKSELRGRIMEKFPDAPGSRVEAAFVYAEQRMMEAFGYE